MISVVSPSPVLTIRSTSSTRIKPAESAASSVGEPAHAKRNLVPPIHFVNWVERRLSYFRQSAAHSRNMSMNFGSTVLVISGLVGVTYRTGVGSSSRRWPTTFSMVTDLPI